MSHPHSDQSGSGNWREPIAIVGIGCRLPGASSADELWSLLDNGIDAVGEYPGGRFPLIDSVYSGTYPGGTVATRSGGFLRDIDKFDAGFFGISTREAPFLDPQHRLFLETAWEAIEDAGIVRSDLAGKLAGVFAGLWASDYETCIREDAPESDFYSTIGSGRYSLSGRVSYLFDLRGPSLTIDSGCSASLAAIHMACRSIQSGDCELALAGGTNAILRPDITLAYSAAGMLSRDGRCRFGDADAAGYVRSEGSAIVVLKSLQRAQAGGDRIYAVIRGSAVNNDGASSGLLVSPSRQGQFDLIRSAVADAGLTPRALEYIEAHGTGTPAGDPVEIEAIGRAVDTDDRRHPVLVGSLKTNIGHTESTAGVAGLIKVALALHHGKIPKSLHHQTPNPKIPWESLPVRVASEASSWNGDGPHYAAVSSFGITGTNACAVLGNAPEEKTITAPDARTHLLTLSAHSEEALRDSARRWQTFLTNAADAALPDICFTAARRRTHQEYRLAVAGSGPRAMAEALGTWAGGEQTADVVSGRVRAMQDPKLAFVFSAVGGQWARMGVSLLGDNPVFRERLIECAEAVNRHGGPDLLSELNVPMESSRLAEAEIAQPAIWSVQLAIVKLWESLGIRPQAVIGHSMGEVTAAVACGALSLDEGAAIVCHRSRISKQKARKGRMAVAGASAAVVAEIIASDKDHIWIAGINGSQSTVLSGDPDAIERVVEELNRREIFCRLINSDVASHSPHMEEARRELEAVLPQLNPQHTDIEFYSTSTGKLEDGSSAGTAYWGNNLRNPVLFWPTLKQMISAGYNAFVEVGPHPVLLHSMQETFSEEQPEAFAVASLHRNSDEYADTLLAFASLHCAGYPVDFSRLYAHGHCVSLPTYAWQRERYWLEIREPRVQLDVPADHLYELHWKTVDAPPASITGARKFAMLGDSTIAEALTDELRTQHCDVISARDEFALDAALQQGAISDVVHVVGGTGREGELDLTPLWNTQTAAVDRLMRTIQQLATNAAGSVPRLWIITSGTLPVDMPGGRLRVETSAISGLSGAIRREHPELQCRHMDVSDTATPEETRTAAQLLMSASVEEILALRGQKLSAPRYESNPDFPAQQLELSTDATYLITGGLGGVGIEVAAWMADRGARHLVLTGRRGPSPEVLAQIGKLRDAGVTVNIVAADISSDAETARLISDVAGMPPLRGIFHAAAVVDDALLTAVTPQQVAKILGPKAAGAWNLHRHTANLTLDFFVLCSSIAVPLSQPGHGVYAAANSFLDAFAAWRRSLGLAATSIQWGVWANTGLAKGAGMQRNSSDYVARGIRPLSTALGVGLLGAALGRDCACVLAAPISWKKFVEGYGEDAFPRIFSAVVPPVAKQESPAEDAQSFAARLAEMKPADRGQAVQEHLLEELAAVLKTSASRIDVQKPFGMLGLDSLLSLELVRRVSSSTGVKLPATAVFNYPTAKLLAAEVARRVGVGEKETAAPAEATAIAPKSESSIDQCSEEEAILALMTTSEPNQQ